MLHSLVQWGKDVQTIVFVSAVVLSMHANVYEVSAIHFRPMARTRGHRIEHRLSKDTYAGAWYRSIIQTVVHRKACKAVLASTVDV